MVLQQTSRLRTTNINLKEAILSIAWLYFGTLSIFLSKADIKDRLGPICSYCTTVTKRVRVLRFVLELVLHKSWQARQCLTTIKTKIDFIRLSPCPLTSKVQLLGVTRFQGLVASRF